MDACGSCTASNSDAGPSKQQSIDEAFELVNSLDDFNERSLLPNDNLMQGIIDAPEVMTKDFSCFNRRIQDQIIDPGMQQGVIYFIGYYLTTSLQPRRCKSLGWY